MSVEIVQPKYPDQEVQELENRKALAAISDLVENAITVSENYISYTDGRLPPLSAKGPVLQDTVDEFYTRYKHEAPCGWNEDKVMERCEQRVTKDQLRQVNGRPQMDPNAIGSSLDQMNTTDRIPRGRLLLLKDNISILKEHQDPNSVVCLPDALGALYDVHSVDACAVVEEELAETVQQKIKVDQQVMEAQKQYDEAAAKGDVIEMERAHRHLIAARYEQVVLYAKRIHIVDGSIEDKDKDSFREELERMKKDAEDAAREFRCEKENMKTALRDDLAKCDETAQEETDKNTKAMNDYDTKQKDLDGQLADVVKQKMDIIEEIRKKAIELNAVLEKQKELVRECTDTKRAEEERKTAFREFLDIEEQHRNRLQRCLTYFEACAPVCDAIDNFVTSMVDKLPFDELESAISKIVDREVNSFMEAYKPFVFDCGDLTVKKTHRLDTLERQARLTKHNRDSAMESLDPNMENYRQELGDIVEQMKAVEGVINALNATQDAGEQVFESVEDTVFASCERNEVTFVHPLQEFGIKSVDDRSKFVDRSMKYVEGEETEVAQKKHQIEEMKLVVEKDNAALERAIAAADNNAPAAITE
eukprot:gene12040-8293_t